MTMSLSYPEKLIWAAAYAAEWSREWERHNNITGHKMQIAACIENAWAAVTDARLAHEEVRESWGEDDGVYLMLRQMSQPESQSGSWA